MFKSAVYKLTIFYVILAISISLIFSSVLFYFAHNELQEGLTKQYAELTIKDGDTSIQHYGVLNKELNHASNKLLLIFIYLNLGVLILAALIGYLLAKRTLKPIQRSLMNQTHFAEEASHELKTPLAAIKASSEAELMTNSKNIKSYRKLLKANIKDIDKLQELINYLLEIAREGDIGHLNKQEINIKNIFNEALSVIQIKARPKKIIFKNKIKSIVFEADPVAIKQLLLIVLDNAIKYSSKDQEIEINTHSAKQELTISIKDHGIGIDKKDLKHVFERFFQANKNKASDLPIDGLGLGLYIAKEIVRRHSGTINIDSHQGNNSGTTIKINLPIK